MSLPPPDHHSATPSGAGLGPLARSRWRHAVLAELAEPGYIDLAPVRDHQARIVDFATTEVSPAAAMLLGLDGEPPAARLLAAIPCAESRRHVVDACRRVASDGRDVAVTARSNEGPLDSIVLQKVFGSTTSVSVGLTCPTAMARLRSAEHALRALDPAAGPSDADSAVRVMVVDDNVDAATSLCDLLEIYGVETAVAFSGAQCLAVAARFDPSLVFIDFDMPGMDGCEALQQLLLQESGCRRTFICLTGRSEPEDHLKCHEAGFSEMVTKPMSFDHLRAVAAIAEE